MYIYNILVFIYYYIYVFVFSKVHIWIQIGMFRPIRVDHTNCLQVAIKTHSFIYIYISIYILAHIYMFMYLRLLKALLRLF